MTLTGGPSKRTERDRPASGLLEHGYGARVRLFDDALLATLLARIGSPEVVAPELPRLVRMAYARMAAEALARELPGAACERPTRMRDRHPREAVWKGRGLDPTGRVVVVNVLRGGIVPSQTCYELCASVLPPENVRLDHVHVARTNDAEGRVNGADLSSSKIPDSVAGATLLLPDPMGATGSTVERVVRHYLERYGRPRRIVVLPMMATPEFLRRVLGLDPELVVYAGRLDRGLSAPDVLALRPGERWDEERGLDDNGYIVPGAGGVGEVLNNAWC